MTRKLVAIFAILMFLSAASAVRHAARKASVYPNILPELEMDPSAEYKSVLASNRIYQNSGADGGSAEQKSTRISNASSSSNDDLVDEDCQSQASRGFSQFSIRLAATEERSIPVSAGQPLRVEGGHNDGISVRGWDRADGLLKACKMAAADDRDLAAQTLAELGITTQDGAITSSGPHNHGDRFWRVQFYLFVPRSTALDLTADNGGISLSNLTGKITAHVRNGGISCAGSGPASTIDLFAQNGGISLDSCIGKINAHTQNGGITLEGGGGDVHLQSSNGGITVRLPRDGWDGAGLEAHSNNGGLVLSVPDGFAAGIEARTSINVTLECKLRDCGTGTRSWDDSYKRLRLGGSEPLIHVSTNNGSLQVVGGDE